MASSNSRKHARKVTLDAAVSNAIEKAVDARKVAAFTVGAAGVLAGAAIAFGATPAMAAETNTTPVDTSTSANTQDVTAKKDDSNKKVDKEQQADETNKQAADSTSAPAPTPAENPAPTPTSTVAQGESRAAGYAANQGSAVTYTSDKDREVSPQSNSTINLSKETKDTLPNMYAWGKSDNVYIENGQNQSVTITLKPTDGSTITKVAIFPSDTNGVENAKSRGFLEYYSDDANAHQSYSGTYEFKVDSSDGTATLTMTNLYRKANMAAEKYAANRCIYVYGKGADGQEVLLYKTNVARAATLVPPKNAGSIVLKYNEKLTEKQIQDKLKAALGAPTEAAGKKSVSEQIVAASKSKGVGGRTGANGAFVQAPDDPEKKVVITDNNAYDTKQVETINTVTSKQGDKVITYKTGAQTLNTHLISDLGYKSDALPLTVARYDTHIDKPIVEDTDPSKVSDEVKADIKRKLAQLNHVAQDKVSINADGTFTINFDGVDAADAPKIPLRDLVLKKIEEKDITVPANDKATIVYNPLAYNNAEIARIKKAIYEANKDNQELGLSATDYENQISLEYLKGNLTASGSANTGISNGMAENKITVKIKTDKAVAEFKSDVTKGKLTKLVNIREDYTVSWEKNKSKINGRDTDEGLSWSEDHKTIIYRYDPTKATAFKSDDVTKLLKATPNDKQAGLRELTGGETLDHEGSNGKDKKSHVYYAIDSKDEPTGALTLGIMSSGYWKGDPQITGTDVNMGDVLAKTGEYKWDDDANPVKLASKDGKIYRARLFVAPYSMETYQHVYAFPDNKNLNNTPKAINVIFVPQTNHKTSDLKKSVDDHKTVAIEGKDVPTQPAYYNASDKKKEAYDEALKTAKTLYESVKDTDESKLTEEQKAQIDNATINLNKARAELDGPDTNKDKLNASIDANGKAAEGATAATPGTVTTDRYKNVNDPDFKTADGKPDTKKNEDAKAAKKAYDEALAEANKVKDDKNATQKAVDEAKAKLDAAREKLNDFATSKDKLNAAIAEHGQVNTGDATQTDPNEKLKTADPTYQNSTPEQRKAYDDAVKKAKDLSADPNASQKDVNAAIDALQKAKAALDAKATDKSKLIAAEKLSFDNPDPKNASKQSTFYKNAKAKADANDQAAKTAVENYDKALDEARKVLKNDKATQAEVDDAKKKLEAAENALHENYKSDANDLTKALADNVTGYLMPAYFNAFDKAKAGDEDAKKAFKDYNDAYQKAKALKKALEDAKNGGTAPDQNQIDEAKKALEEARKVIDKYATNTSRLSAAVLNDIAIQKSPAYKNVSADDASEEAKEAKKKYDAAVDKLHKALANKLPKDQQNGHDIPDGNTPKKDGDLNDKDYLKDIQAHKNGEPLDRDVDDILKEMNAAAAELNKFATKTDELLKSVNEHDNTQQTPAYKNANHPDFKQADGTDDTAKNTAAKAAVDAYDDALNKAKELLKNPAATQKEVNDALKKLDDARKALDAYNTDTTKLKESVDKHGSTEGPAATEGTQTSDAYRNASDPHFMKEEGGKLVPDDTKNKNAAAAKKAYDEALTKAQELLKKHDDKATPQDAKPIQKEIDAALKALDDARTEIEKYKTVTTDLENEIKKSTPEHAAVTEDDFENTPEFKNAKAKTSDGQTNADVAAYQKALDKARDLVKAANPTDPDAKNSSHPTQKQINEALDALKAAKKQIEDNYKTNLEALTAAKDFAGGDFKKTPEYKNALAKKTAGDQGATAALDKDGEQTGFDNVLKKVTEKLNDEDWKKKATQKQVNALLKQLQDAQEKIAKEYKTDAKLLENEVGDKDAQGNDVIPPFEASVAYKNALEKAKTEDANTTDTNSATKKLEAYNKALKAAQELINKVNNPDPNAEADKQPTQKDVDDALAALKKAKKDIDDAFKTNASALKNEADDKDEHGNAKADKDKFEKSTEYQNALAKTDADSKKDVQTYKDALKKANELLELFGEDGNPKADIPAGKQIPTQQEVDEAQKALKEIKDKILANYKTSPVDLQKEVDLSKDGDKRNGLFEDTPEFKNADAKKGEDGKDNADMAAYKKALADAKALLDAFDRTTGKPKDKLPEGMAQAPTQKQLDDALDALQAAKKKITDGYKTDPSKLKSEADADDTFKKTPEYQNAQAKGDDASKQALEDYEKALEDANKVLGDKDATQAQVDEALKKLQDAKDKLKAGNSTDKSKLQDEADDDANFRKSPYFIIGNKADIEAYEDALAEARSVLADPNATQAQVDAALKKLEDAKKRILDFLSHFGGSGNGTGDWNGYGFVNGHESYGALVDKTALQIEVNNAVDANANTAQAVAYRQALAEAKSVLNDPNATQAQVDAALKKLQAAKAALLNSLSGASGHKIAKTGAATGLFAGFAVIFAGLGAAGVASRRRKHSKE